MALSVVSSVAQYLGGLLVQEKELLSGVADQILKIQGEMTRIQCFLKDADARQDKSESVRNWVSEIKELSYDVEDAIDSYILKARFASSFHPKKYIQLHKIGKKIETLQSKIQDITRSIATYGFIRTGEREGTSSATEMQRQLRQSYPHYDDEDVIGIEDNIKLLVAELINKEGPHLVSIVGMGGLGKTTLAKKVYNHNDVKHHFDCCAWSFISQQFQGGTILRGILRKVCNPKEETGLETLDDGELKEKLYNLLEDKCYLVVLDDIWSIEAWNVLKSAFPKGKMGSKIVFTTRIKDVASYADPSGFLHEPACLTDEQSWELFCKKTSLGKNVPSSSSSSYSSNAEKKEKLGRGMIKKCGGLPLVVVVLGGVLATKESIQEWVMVAKDIGMYLNKAQQQQSDDISSILSLSYHDLPSYLKPCFLYLGLFPEDTEVHKRQLIPMWIAEGFVLHDRQGTTKEEMGEEYLLELINRSMIQVVERSFHGNIKKCCLHDIMRDLCLWKAKEANFLCTFEGRTSTGDSSSSSSSSSSTSVVTSISNHQIRRHAIHYTCERYVFMQQSTRSPHFRAFSIWDLRNRFESIATLDFVCKKFNFLRVLVLENVIIYSLPRAIGDLIHLRYLRLKAVRKLRFRSLYNEHDIDALPMVTKVPPTIGNLQSLQFLILYKIDTLPNVLWKMKQLTYCHCYCGDCYSTLTHDSKPLRVDGLENLSTLRLQWGEELLLGFALPKLTNLRKLHLSEIDGTDCKSLHQLSISRLDRLQCLSLHFQIISHDYDWSSLSSCRSLWKLYLEGIKKLPKLKEFPSNLTKLVLVMSTWEEDLVPTLEMLPNLESLIISHGDDGTSKYCFSAKGFRRLQYLRLFDLNNLEELEVEKGAMPCLMHLQIWYCEMLRMLPEGLKSITTLKKLEVIDMPVEFKERLQEDGEDWHKIQHVPSIITHRHTRHN